MTPRAVPPDYDRDPGRFRLARSVQRRHARAGDVHERVAERLIAAYATPVLDVGCGEGELARLSRRVHGSGWTARRPCQPSVQGEATALPFADQSFGSVALLYVLYTGLFTDVEIERWDAPLLDLPSRDAVRDYLIGKGVEPGRADAAAAATQVPLSVTKRGALVFAQRS